MAATRKKSAAALEREVAALKDRISHVEGECLAYNAFVRYWGPPVGHYFVTSPRQLHGWLVYIGPEGGALFFDSLTDRAAYKASRADMFRALAEDESPGNEKRLASYELATSQERAWRARYFTPTNEVQP